MTGTIEPLTLPDTPIRSNFAHTLAVLEMTSGIVLFGFSLWLFLQADNAAGRVAIKLGVFSVVVFCCGARLKSVKQLKVSTQCIFALAAMMAYIEFCTTHAEWYLRF